MQLGCVPVTAGADGTGGALLMVMVFDACDVPHAVLANTEYAPGDKFEKFPLRLLTIMTPPEKSLYVTPLTGNVTFIDAVCVHVGCVPVIEGCEGKVGATLIVTMFDDGDVPHVLPAVTVYVPGNKFEK